MSPSVRIAVVELSKIGWIVTRDGTTLLRFDTKALAEDYARELRYHCRCGHEDYCGSGCGGHTE